MQFETAQDIVDTAIESASGKSLVRVFNSKDECFEIADVLGLADPPVFTEVYDSRRDKIIRK